MNSIILKKTSVSLGCLLLVTISWGQSISNSSLSCLNKTDAEKILGQPATLTENTIEEKDDAVKYRCTYTATKNEAATGKTGNLYYMFEKYTNETSAKIVYAGIVAQNSNMPNFKTLNSIGDEALRHTDNENFDMIIVRKGDMILRLKVNKLTAFTSVTDLQTVAKKLAAKL